MARRKSKKDQSDTLVDLVEAREHAQDFVDRNQNLIFGALAAVVLIAGGIFAYNNFFKKPKQKEALGQMWKAEQQFQQDSFALALTNPGVDYDGFKQLVEDYGSVPSGNAATYYAGISYLHLGEFDAAISYLNDVDAEGEVLPIMKYGALGDAYSEKGEFDKALSNYKKAVSAADNEALTPIYLMRLGMLNEKQGNLGEARKAYERVKKEYATSTLARDAAKYLVRLGAEG